MERLRRKAIVSLLNKVQTQMCENLKKSLAFLNFDGEREIVRITLRSWLTMVTLTWVSG